MAYDQHLGAPVSESHWCGVSIMHDDTDLAPRYDAARHLPAGTVRLWLEAMTRQVPPADIRTIVDVGCGTGRFSAALADAFDADVIGVDPSLTMLA